MPVTFRINETYQHKDKIINELQTRFHYEGTISFEEEKIECVHPISWYSDNLIWEVDCFTIH